jgi:hypothetical protein
MSSRSPPDAVAVTVGGPGPRSTTRSDPVQRKASAHLVSTDPVPSSRCCNEEEEPKKSEGGDMSTGRPEYLPVDPLPWTTSASILRIPPTHAGGWRRLEYRHRPMKSWSPHTKLSNRLARVTASQMFLPLPPPSAPLRGNWCPDPLPTRH